MNERVLACRVPRFGGTLIAVKHVLEGGRGREEDVEETRMKGKA